MSFNKILEGLSVFGEIFLYFTGIVIALLIGIVIMVFVSPWYILGMFFAFLLGCWVYKDAKKRKSDVAPAWAIATFAMAIVFLPAYLVFRPDMPKNDSNLTATYAVELCPHCGKYYRKPAKFCPNCGADTNS